MEAEACPGRKKLELTAAAGVTLNFCDDVYDQRKMT